MSRYTGENRGIRRRRKVQRHKKEMEALYCVIDIGSNTVRLVIYRMTEAGPQAILNNKAAVGLAAYVDREGALSQEGIDRLIGALQEFRQALELLPRCRVFPFATASLRNICNTDDVVRQVEAACRMRPQVLTGREEALLDYRGALSVLDPAGGVMADVGGGSTEVVLFREGAVLAAESLPFGSLNLYRRFCRDVFPAPRELKEMKRELREALKQALPSPEDLPTRTLCAIGGSARGVLAMARQEGRGTELTYPAGYLKALLTRGEEQPKKLLQQILRIAPDRVHTLLPGALILRVIARAYGCETVSTSPYGVREGYLSWRLEEESRTGESAFREHGSLSPADPQAPPGK